ncbi:hypothetical protein GM555_09270 [Commensalibacter sp. ESL0366]|nr:hypothetical protein [Commensalibacter melissae]
MKRDAARKEATPLHLKLPHINETSCSVPVSMNDPSQIQAGRIALNPLINE